VAKKKTTNITKVQANAALARPDFMADAPLGIDDLRQYVTPPRIKVVQKQARTDLLDMFGVGDVIVVPANIVVTEMGRTDKGQPTGEADPFFIVPLFFYVEWCTWNPLELKGKVPAIRDRSFDPKSALALKAKSSEHRKELIPGEKDLYMRHVEHLNFIVMLYDHPTLGGAPVVMTFARGEHFSGRGLCNLIKLRKAPLYGCVFECHLGHRENEQGDWWGLDIINPAGDVSPWVNAEEFEAFKALHLEFVKAHQDARIRVDYDEAEADPAAVPQAKEEF